MRRRNESMAERSRGRRTPESETRNVDPQDVPTIPDEWTREEFLRDLRRATGHREEPDESGQATG